MVLESRDVLVFYFALVSETVAHDFQRFNLNLKRHDRSLILFESLF